MDTLQEYRLVLVGEKHDNTVHHQIKRRILAHLTNDQTHVIFEMLDESQRPLIARLTANDSLEAIRTKLQWHDSQWSWDDYGPQIHTVLQHQGTIHPGNLSEERVHALYQGEHQGLQFNPRFASLQALNHKQSSLILDQLYISHCEIIPREALNSMLTIQVARDSSMAHSMLMASEGQSSANSILVAGGFHTRRDLGVPVHLSARSAQADAIIVRLEEVDPVLIDPRNHDMATTDIADFLWFTPAAPKQDYCAGLRSRFGSK